MTTEQVRQRLRAKHGKAGWIWLEEVRSTTGYMPRGGMTIADGLAFGLWPSLGCEIHGFEVKVTRADLLKEIQRPDKADNIAQYCERWWLAVGDKSIVKLEELDPTWGVMIPHGQGLRVLRGAKLRETQPIEKDFFMSLVRQLYRESPSNAEEERAYKKGLKDGDARTAREFLQKLGDTGKIIKNVREFEASSGIEITRSWNPGDLGELVKALEVGTGVEQVMYYLEQITKQLPGVQKSVEDLYKLSKKYSNFKKKKLKVR